MPEKTKSDVLQGIAVVGMAGRFPGAKNLEVFWQNLRNGVEGTTFFTDEELLEAGVSAELLRNPNYVKAGAMLEGFDLFDAHFFDYSPREAELMDPQHRVFLEVAWEALENAAYDPQQFGGAIGVYAGMSMSAYLYHNIHSNPDLVANAAGMELMIGNDKDFVGMNLSYKFDLRGPSVNIQTACSTSLVAIAQACQALQDYHCDMALAGGVSIGLVQKMGYLYQPGGIASPDGRCRAFDARARGTFVGDGAGVVVLKRLEDALADGDTILAVVRGWAVNNDGANKIGYTAPSIEGQAEVIALAQAIAGVEPDSIGYIEAHGTGTELGDPIEVAALTRVFREKTARKRFCAIGSVKTNIGHLDAAAGVAGFIKTVLALVHKELPPSLHFEKPNPKIDFENSPFYVINKLAPWPRPQGDVPRRAGVSSFGIGGTNAHVVLEEAPEPVSEATGRPYAMLFLSAKTESALEQQILRLAEHLEKHPSCLPADVAYTLQVGRKAFPHRAALVCTGIADAIAGLRATDSRAMQRRYSEPGSRAVTYMFPGQGAQYVNMGRELYETEPIFREHVDACCDRLQPQLGSDLRQVLYPDLFGSASGREQAEQKLKQTAITQPALFVVEYAMARLLMAWGIEPQALIGHSIGEYVAACLAGVFSLHDALKLVAARGELMQRMSPGQMLAVSLAEAELVRLLDDGLDLAAVNAPALCVVSGKRESIEALQAELTGRRIQHRLLRTSHAFHSAMMEPILQAFAEIVGTVRLSPPKLPFISNVSGTWITDAQATDPGYWSAHLRRTVRFAGGVAELLKEPSRVYLEVGPGRTLSSLTKMVIAAHRPHAPETGTQPEPVASMRHPDDNRSDLECLAGALSQLWLQGVTPNWRAYYHNERRRRLPLPSYPFERQRYWIEPGANGAAQTVVGDQIRKKSKIDDWFYLPSWKAVPLAGARRPGEGERRRYLVLRNRAGLPNSLLQALREAGNQVIEVEPGDSFAWLDEARSTVNPRHPEDFVALFGALRDRGELPDVVLHLWTLELEQSFADSPDDLQRAALDLGFFPLVYLARAAGRQNVTSPLQIIVVTNAAQPFISTEGLIPEKSTMLGACRVIPQEYPNIRCRLLDIETKAGASTTAKPQIMAELHPEAHEPVVVLRGGTRWVQHFEPLSMPAPSEPEPWRHGGVYLITGGLGRIGLTLATYLHRKWQARLVLTSRQALPEPDAWQAWLEKHDAGETTGKRIQALKELVDSGANVLTVCADVADRDSMRAAVARVEAQFGRLDGVIHAAGVLDGSGIGSIDTSGPEQYAVQFRPKLDGLKVLGEIFHDRELDFVILLSSISTVLGGLGFAGYAAANCFMDTFAFQRNRSSQFPWICIDWDAWQFEVQETNGRPATSATGLLALQPEEGLEALTRIVASNLDWVIVSTGDLHKRMLQWVLRKPGEESVQNEKRKQHARPPLRQSYVAPENEVQQSLVAIWQQAFGIEPIGIHDNFFDLGGHSLMALRVVSRIQAEFGIALTLQHFFEKSTIAELAELIFEKLVAQEDSESLAAMLDELENEG